MSFFIDVITHTSSMLYSLEFDGANYCSVINLEGLDYSPRLPDSRHPKTRATAPDFGHTDGMQPALGFGKQ